MSGVRETKYGVSLIQLKGLKEFQLSLRKKKVKMEQKEVMNVLGTVNTLIQMLQSEKHMVGTVSVGNGKLVIGSDRSAHTIFLRDIIAVNITENNATIQLLPDSLFDKLTFYFNEDQCRRFMASLPPICRPDNNQYVDTDVSSEESDLNDSGSGRTQCGRTSSVSENESSSGDDEGR